MPCRAPEEEKRGGGRERWGGEEGTGGEREGRKEGGEGEGMRKKEGGEGRERQGWWERERERGDNRRDVRTYIS